VVLVVEDDADILGMLQATLELAGYEVESAADGLMALQKVRQAPPDLVILDLNMPRMGGADFLYAWRSGFETPGVPVIVITAESRALRAQDLGVSACFPKPFDTNQLLGYVTDLLAVPSQARAAAGRDPRGVEMAGVAYDLADALSALVISAEQVTGAPELAEGLRPIAAVGLDAAQRASVLARRLHHLINDPE
jgi:DNA-binding response OmpR family regulator